MKLASSLTVTVRKRDDPRSSCNFCQVTAFTALAEITAPTIYPSQTSTGLTATCSTRSPGGTTAAGARTYCYPYTRKKGYVTAINFASLLSMYEVR